MASPVISSYMASVAVESTQDRSTPTIIYMSLAFLKEKLNLFLADLKFCLKQKYHRRAHFTLRAAQLCASLSHWGVLALPLCG